MFIAVFVRRLRPGKTYEDFLDAWYPDQGFGFGGRGPITAVNLDDEREILTIGLVDLPDKTALGEAFKRVGEQESVRHGRIDGVIESTSLRAIYEQRDEFDFSTDETVKAGRPNWRTDLTT
jgi:hypothetical protein